MCVREGVQGVLLLDADNVSEFTKKRDSELMI